MSRVDPGVGGASTQPVNDPAVALGLQPPLDPADLANRPPQQPGGLRLGSRPRLDLGHDLQNIPFPLTHRDPLPVHPPLP